ncbi:MAG: 50S ribosomal protein L10 [Candidatus Omnitrophica bacterium]|nr:50S ribosomal protein L10 [Candidatus Omnitrophota bacterium]
MPSPVKEKMMEEIRKDFKANRYAFVTSFIGLPVADLSEFRRIMEKVSRRSVVVKHKLAEKIFSEMKVSDAGKLLKGSVVITLGDKDPQVISKAILDFVKSNEKIQPTGMVFENVVYGQDFVKQLAKLPSRHELLTQVAVRVKSPISGFVMTLGQMTRGLVVALNEIKKKREAAPAAA